MLISDEYVALNRELHARKPTFGKSGHRHADRVEALMAEYGCSSVLDYGCGKGGLVRKLRQRDVDVTGYDPAVADYADMDIDLMRTMYNDGIITTNPFDLVVCFDVMEHIEPECLGDVLRHIGKCANVAIYLEIATRKAKKVLSDGRNAHLIVKNSTWWLRKIEKHLPEFMVVRDHEKAGHHVEYTLKRMHREHTAC